jgi:hypothetical protein
VTFRVGNNHDGDIVKLERLDWFGEEKGAVTYWHGANFSIAHWSQVSL